MRFGIEEKYWSIINDVFARHPHVHQVVLYGSRAKGTNKRFSDVDITLKGPDVDWRDLLSVSSQLEESTLPYLFDVSLFKTLKNEALIDHINRRGITIYERC
ncbi:MAG: nucleotidyltransferase domain-containing protein [Muribaculaceae bacterium]|nr:nucleotidyltransferase domain-containing protein [Muribaculaceae bacterium]